MRIHTLAHYGYCFRYCRCRLARSLTTRACIDDINDNHDHIPLAFNFNEGDLPPLKAADGVINAADLASPIRSYSSRFLPKAAHLPRVISILPTG